MLENIYFFRVISIKCRLITYSNIIKSEFTCQSDIRSQNSFIRVRSRNECSCRKFIYDMYMYLKKNTLEEYFRHIIVMYLESHIPSIKEKLSFI